MTAGWLQTADVAVDDLNSQDLSSGGISGVHYHAMCAELNTGVTQARHALYRWVSGIPSSCCLLT